MIICENTIFNKIKNMLIQLDVNFYEGLDYIQLSGITVKIKPSFLHDTIYMINELPYYPYTKEEEGLLRALKWYWVFQIGEEK